MNEPDRQSPLQVENLCKTFQRGDSSVSALSGVSLSMGTGEFVAIMGASGSGKSTLLHAVAGLTDIDSGRVLIAGQDLALLSDARLTRFRQQQLGIVFQSFNLIPSLTAEDNIRLPCPSGTECEGRVESLLDTLGMKSRRQHKPGALSGGEQQRIAIARALVCDPAILLADEPTGSLDSVTGQEICQLLRRLCDEQQRTILIVTHEPHVAMWADRVVVLKDGANLADFETGNTEDPQQVANRYQSLLRSEAG